MITKTESKTVTSNISLGGLLGTETDSSKLLVPSGADPWVIYHGGWYYYCRVLDDWQILVNKAKRLDDIGKDNHVVWQHPLGRSEAEVWAPELHFLRGKWYIYFTMGKAEKHRMYVLEATTDDPQGTYKLKGKIADQTDKWAIDGTVLELDEKLYFVWSGWEGDTDGEQNLYIAAMGNPWTISSKRVCIARPTYAWEKTTREGLPSVNEGPEVLKREGKTFIVYSASHSLTDDYCLGILELTGKDPLKAESWVKDCQPVFCSSSNAFAPGHASFVECPDDSSWIVYHTARYSGAGWDRQIQAQKFDWSLDGLPNFGSPLAFSETT